MPQSETWGQWQTSSCLPLLVQWTKSRESGVPQYYPWEVVAGFKLAAVLFALFFLLKLWNAFHCQGIKRLPAWEVPRCWWGWASEGEDLNTFVNNCQPNWLWQAHLILFLCWLYVWRGVHVNLYKAYLFTSTDRKYFTLDFWLLASYTSYDVIHCSEGGILLFLLCF